MEMHTGMTMTHKGMFIMLRRMHAHRCVFYELDRDLLGLVVMVMVDAVDAGETGQVRSAATLWGRVEVLCWSSSLTLRST